VASTRQQFEFHRDDRGAVVELMMELAGGQGWMNFDAGVDEEVPVPPRSGMFAVFSGRGPDLPHGSWVPALGAPTSIGVQHASGVGAVKRLAAAGVTIAPSWRVLQDHPRRGLVVAIPAGELVSVQDHDEVLIWLLAAGSVLTTIPLNGFWLATVVRKR
jgi:hypothetical protein